MKARTKERECKGLQNSKASQMDQFQQVSQQQIQGASGAHPQQQSLQGITYHCPVRNHSERGGQIQE